MAYKAPAEDFLEILSSDLGHGEQLVKVYLERRTQLENAQRELRAARIAFDEVSKNVADHLLKVYQGIHRIEHHTEGETWYRE